MADDKIREMRIEILDKISANGCYQLPIGFIYEQPSTTLHKALRELRDLSFIKCKGVNRLGFEEWITTEPVEEITSVRGATPST